MELLLIYVLIAFLLLIFLALQILIYNPKQLPLLNLPPGRTGWPLLGENLEFLSSGWSGKPQKFVFDRIERYSSECFRTSILGQPMVFLCGPSGNKFLFANENKLVKFWLPETIKKIFPELLLSNYNDDNKKTRRFLHQFLKPEALQKYVGIMDAFTQRDFASCWDGRDEIKVFPFVQDYTFRLACRLFLSIEDPDCIARLAHPFHLVLYGIFSIPVDLPGTTFNKGIKAAKVITKEITEIVKERKLDLGSQKATPTQDILSHMLSAVDDNGERLSELDAAHKIVAFLLGSHDTLSSVIPVIVKYLAELPHIYDAVYTEQMEIAKSKMPGELLNWDDLQKMKYTWNVVCEVMRLQPPVQGAFREALTKFTYAGFTIPKGWKLYWSALSTHLDPQFFPDPEKFDPTRFEGNGPAPYTFVPFGGGARMCPGQAYARSEILVLMHNLVKRFRWEKVIPDEQIIVNPMPSPSKGLPVRLIPHDMTNKQE